MRLVKATARKSRAQRPSQIESVRRDLHHHRLVPCLAPSRPSRAERQAPQEWYARPERPAPYPRSTVPISPACRPAWSSRWATKNADVVLPLVPVIPTVRSSRAGTTVESRGHRAHCQRTEGTTAWARADPAAAQRRAPRPHAPPHRRRTRARRERTRERRRRELPGSGLSLR